MQLIELVAVMPRMMYSLMIMAWLLLRIMVRIRKRSMETFAPDYGPVYLIHSGLPAARAGANVAVFVPFGRKKWR